MKLKELYIFSFNAGKDGRGTLKFHDVELTDADALTSNPYLNFYYISESDGGKRTARFRKENIAGYSYTE